MIARVFRRHDPFLDRLDGEVRDRLRWWLVVVGLVLLGAGSPAVLGPAFVTFASGGAEAAESTPGAQRRAHASITPSTRRDTP
ncbi:MAG: hypothetical protein AAGF92_16050 [Myxococcota bacterium]